MFCRQCCESRSSGRDEGHRQEEGANSVEEARRQAAVEIAVDHEELLEIRKETTSDKEEGAKITSTWAQLVSGKARMQEVLRSGGEEAAPVVGRSGGEVVGPAKEGEVARRETGELQEVGNC